MRRRQLLSSALAGSLFLAGCQQRDTDAKTTTTTATSPTASATRTTEPTTIETEQTEPTEPSEAVIGGDSWRLPDSVWPQPYRSPSKTAYLPSGPGFTSAPDIDWSRTPTTEKDPYSPAFTPPAIVDDELYTVQALLFGPQVAQPEEHFLNALTPDGDERWTEPITADDDSTPVPTFPVVHGDHALVGVDKEVQVFDRETGDLAWTVGVEDSVEGLIPTPDRVYVRAGRSICAIAAERRRWTTPFEEYPGTLAVGIDAVFATTSRRLHRLDPASGRIRWTQELPAVEGGWAVNRLLAVPGGVLARQNSGHLYAYTASGKEVWRTRGIEDALATDGNTLFAGTNGSVRALRVADGEPLWERRCEEIPGCGGGRQPLSLAATADNVYVPLEDQTLAALDTRDGSVRWSQSTPEMVERIALTTDAVYGVGDSLDPLVRFAVNN